jgi:Histidine kinase
MSTLIHNLRLARHDFFKLRKHRDAPAWAMWLLTTGVGLAWGVGLLSLFGVVGGRVLSVNYWLQQGPPFIATALVIGFVFHSVYTLIERLAPQRFIDWTNGEPGLLVSLFFGFVSMACAVGGMGLAFLLIGSLPGMERVSWTSERSWLSFALTSVFASFIWGLWAWQEWHDEQLKRRTKEAELRLLQAQIEPHFLFNTLANVRSLIDFAPREAGEMLDAFTDHLRASLTGMRAETVSLDQELTLLGHYLRLMQMRMGDRLSFSIEADAQARAVMLPPLLLQPLVENAIHHGLEGQVEPGHVRIEARVAGNVLQVLVQDDGIGLDAPRKRAGNGVATQNIRERLSRRYGPSARFHLEPARPKGTRALLELPLTP